jgi:hypothetical protein
MESSLLFRVIGESNRVLIVDYYVLSLYNDGCLEFQTMDDLDKPSLVKISWKEKITNREIKEILTQIETSLSGVTSKRRRCTQPHHGFEVWVRPNFYTYNTKVQTQDFFTWFKTWLCEKRHKHED